MSINFPRRHSIREGCAALDSERPFRVLSKWVISEPNNRLMIPLSLCTTRCNHFSCTRESKERPGMKGKRASLSGNQPRDPWKLKGWRIRQRWETESFRWRAKAPLVIRDPFRECHMAFNASPPIATNDWMDTKANWMMKWRRRGMSRLVLSFLGCESLSGSFDGFSRNSIFNAGDDGRIEPSFA